MGGLRPGDDLRRAITILFVFCALACSTSRRESSNGVAGATTRPADDSIGVMTFNLRFAGATPPNAWWQRRSVVRDCIRQADPDIFGTQEGLYPQLKDIGADFAPAYDWVGLGRDGGSRGEFMAIYFKKDRFDPIEYDHFWLSDTPAVIGSTTWGHSNRRMVTWVRFLDRRTNKQFYFWNTHFDHQVQPAREKSARLVRERVEAIKTNLPVILLGDFNAKARANKAYDILTEDNFFTDTYTGEEAGTFHNFTGTPGKQGRIDWIFLRGNVKTTAPTEIIRYNQNGQFPSDHFPVMTRVRLE
jgi:endonuclease/exonuclease/phosphatase family metal-dependent hydrolase